MLPLEKDSFLLKACSGNFIVLKGETLAANSVNIFDAEHFNGKKMKKEINSFKKITGQQ